MSETNAAYSWVWKRHVSEEERQTAKYRNAVMRAGRKALNDIR